MIAHTPGPWRVGRLSFEFNSPSSPRIAIEREVTYVEGATPTVYHLGYVSYPTSPPGTVGEDERQANARLIAAAPELLADLTELLARVDERCGGRMEGNTALAKACDSARATIAKAVRHG